MEILINTIAARAIIELIAFVIVILLKSASKNPWPIRTEMDGFDKNIC